MWIKRVFSVVVLYVIVVSLWLRNDGNLFVRQDVESNRLITLLQMELSHPDKLPQNSFVHEQQMEPVVSGELSWHFWIYFTSQWNFRLLTASLKTLIMLQWLIYKLEHVLLNIIVGTNVQVRVVVNMNTRRNLSVRLDDHLAISHAELSVHFSRRNVDNQFSRFSSLSILSRIFRLQILTNIIFFKCSRALVCTGRNVEVVGSSHIKGPRCFIEQETLPVLLSTGWIQERIGAWFHNRTKINWGPYGKLT